jgi:Tfp pilus assembly protein PilE
MINKRRGISLIVLIITVVIIVILATAVIVNLVQTNVIDKTKEAVVQQDFKTFQDELNLYLADKYAETLGKFEYTSLNLTKKSQIQK